MHFDSLSLTRNSFKPDHTQAWDWYQKSEKIVESYASNIMSVWSKLAELLIKSVNDTNHIEKPFLILPDCGYYEHKFVIDIRKGRGSNSAEYKEARKFELYVRFYAKEN